MLSPLDSSAETEVSVRREDQEKINEFSRLNPKKEALQKEVEDLQKEVGELTDAAEHAEMALGDGDDLLQLKVGDAFFCTSEDDVEEFVTAAKEKKEARLATVQGELDAVLERQADLKKDLYARFGTSINLEDAPQ